MTDNTKEPPKITSVEKAKDPRRVAAGKRLAEISKAAKEKKMRQRIESEYTEQGRCDNGWGRIGFIVGLLGVSIAAYSLYYRMKQDNPPPKKPREPIQHVVIEKRKLDNFDE